MVSMSCCFIILYRNYLCRLSGPAEKGGGGGEEGVTAPHPQFLKTIKIALLN